MEASPEEKRAILGENGLLNARQTAEIRDGRLILTCEQHDFDTWTQVCTIILDREATQRLRKVLEDVRQ